MVLIFSNDTITTDGTEQDLFDITSDQHFATWLFTHNMQSGDTITIKVYVLDENAAVMRLYETQTVTGAQTDPAIFIPFIPTKQYKVSIQRTAGTDRSFNWMRIQSS